MELPWGNEVSNQFITIVGLITSNGKYGPNIMACEWTQQISYKPGLIAVSIRPQDATHDNIMDTKVFGVNICSTEQSVISSVAGGSSGKKVDKIKLLEALGFNFYQANEIQVPMVEAAAANIECKLVNQLSSGDHTLFIGEVVRAKINSDKNPLSLHNGKYWIMNQNVVKPSAEEREKIKKLTKEFERSE